MVNFLKKNVKYIVLIIALILIPQSLNIQSELNMRVIVTAMAVDYKEGEYQVSAQVVKTSGIQEGSGAQVDIIDAKGKTVSDAVGKLGLVLGKTIGLSHVSFIILGQPLLMEDKVMESLDYFMRENLIPTNALLLVSEKEGKEELEKTKKLQLSSAVGLQKIFLYKQTNASGVMMPLQDFVNDYFKLSKSSIISGIKIEDQDSEQSGGSSDSSGGGSGGSGGSSSSGGSGEKNARIKYDNKLYLFNSGSYACTIEEDDELSGIYLANEKSIEGSVTIEHITNDEMQDATLSIYVRDKKSWLEVYFDEFGKPHCTMKISTNRNEVYTIEQDNITLKLYETQNSLLPEDVITKAEEKIKENVLKAFNRAKEYNVDIMELGDRLYKKSPKKWRAFLKDINTENYIQHLDLNVEVKFNKQL